MPNQWVEKPKLCFMEEKNMNCENWGLNLVLKMMNRWSHLYLFMFFTTWNFANYWWIDYFSDQKNMGTLNVNVAVVSV